MNVVDVGVMMIVVGLIGCILMWYDSGSCEEVVGWFFVGEVGKLCVVFEL